MSRPSLSGRIWRPGVALTTTLAVVSVLGVLASGPARAAGPRTPQWWLSSLQVTQAWRQSEGAGITVAVLGTGVDTRYPGLSGAVTTGPDETGTGAAGREPGGPYWGVEGTAVADLIAGHGSALTGVAPRAKILSVRVTLEFNDPLAADQAVSRLLPAAIAAGIRYAASHGARIIDLPLDPGTLGLTGRGDPAAAGGSTAERAAVSYALSQGIVLVAPSGDDREGPAIINYPAIYPGVIAVGAVDRAGRLAEFSSMRTGATLTAPGVALASAVPPDGTVAISSTSAASGIVAGVAALIRSRFPRLTVAQVTRALVASTGRVLATGGNSLPPVPAGLPAGTGYGTVNATRALAAAAAISTASQPRPTASATPPATPAPHRPTATATATAHRTAASALAGTVLRDALAAVALVIALLVAALLVLSGRRSRHRRAAAERNRSPGQHEQHPGAEAGAVPAEQRAGTEPRS